MAPKLGTLVIHLRLPFQAALSVIFLWGVYLSTGRFAGTTLLSWIAFTVGLSGGATAFNSYYDRDRGPVGGLRNPPPVTPALFPFSLAVQALGLVGALLVSARVAAVYLLAALLFLAYSHPRIRTKRHPWRSMATVSIASGALVLLAGAWSARGSPPEFPSWRVPFGMISASLFVAGFYPLTQITQIGEDRLRGDRTFALVYGRAASFAWAIPVLGVSAAMNVLLALSIGGSAPASGLAMGGVALLFLLLRWRRDPLLDSTTRSDTLAYAAAGMHAVLVVHQVFLG
jgi:1,4-dihydroxy-2-naphthoate octaprenyltransferase